jgi:hypothetical protein
MKVITESIELEADGWKVTIMLGTDGDSWGWRRSVQLKTGGWGGPMGHFTHEREREAFDESISEITREIKKYCYHWDEDGQGIIEELGRYSVERYQLELF